MIHEELITTVPMDGNRLMDGNWSHSHLASARWPLRDVNWKPFKRFPCSLPMRNTWLKPGVNERELYHSDYMVHF